MKRFLTSISNFAPENGSGLSRKRLGIGSAISRKLFSVLAFLLFIGVGQAWGAIEAGTYELITSTSGLVSGSHYIIVSSKSNGTAYAIARTSKSDNRATVAVTVSSEKVSVAANSDVMTFTLGGDNTNGWTFSTDNYAGTAGMLAATSSTNNRLGVVASPGNNGKWAISFSSGLAKPVAKGTNSRKYMKYNYNNGTPIFNCYSGSGSESLYIYKKTASGYTLTFKETGGSNNGSGSAAANATSMTIGTAPTPATGKMVDGYYAENTLTTRVANANGSWAADNITGWVTSGKFTKGEAANLYIKWTDLVTTVTLDKGTDGTEDGTATITYNATSFTSITDATKTGYHLNGYYTLATGGSKVINADGSLVSSLSGWTSSGKWVKNATTEKLYAQWTIDTYTIHWKVNGNDWEGSTHGSPSTSANYNTKPSTIPTAPASSDCDNSKVFVGWTATPIVGTTNTFPSDLFYTKEAAPNITGNTTFYAVFATGGVATFNSSTLSGLTEDDTYWSWTHDASGTVFDLYGDYSSRSNNIWVIGYGSSGTYGEITAPASSYLANVAITLSAASNKVVSVTQGTLTTNSTAQNVVFRSAQSSTQLKPATSSTQTKITNMVITYVSSTPAFATSCCSSLASINGSFSLPHT